MNFLSTIGSDDGGKKLTVFLLESIRINVFRKMSQQKQKQQSKVIPTHFRKVGGMLHGWHVENLWNLSKDLPILEIHLDDVGVLDSNRWFQQQPRDGSTTVNNNIPTVRNIANHCKQIMDCDLNYPIILCPHGRSMDGSHRVAKAYMLNHKTIKAVQFSTMPKPDIIQPFSI